MTHGIERVGDTIRRPTGASSPFVRAVLEHLEIRAFVGAPRWLGIDGSGREILSYLPGDVPADLGHFTADQLASAARLLRAFHDATLDFDARGTHEVVCHGDASPCNCIFRDGRPCALIDFDAAHPGARREDVGYASWLWLDIGNEDWNPLHQGRRLGEFVVAYGDFDTADAIPAVLDAQTELSGRAGAPASTQEWAQRCWQWSHDNRAGLEAGMALACHTPRR